MRPGYKGLVTGPSMCKKTPYPNIKTCILNGLQPQISVNFSNIKCAHQGQPKLVLAHKMYGFPFYDKQGLFGISNRDNYVIIHKTDKEFILLQKFLSSKLALLVFETTRYRMKYLEKYAFEFLPDITKIKEFPDMFDENILFDFFNFNDLERKAINYLHKKQYLSF
jgi:hypothetical protein